MRFFYFLLLALVASLAINEFCLADTPTEAEELQASNPQTEDGIRPDFKMPKLFNFDRFKIMFNKHYPSIVEGVVRYKLFLGRCLASFVSIVNYKHRRAPHFLRINQMSDDTPKERARRYPDADKMRVQVPPGMLMANEQDLKIELAKIQAHSKEPGFKDLAEELENLRRSEEKEEQEVLSRGRRSLWSARKESLELNMHDMPTEQLLTPILKAEEPEEVKRKMKTRVPSNNPLRAPLELASSAGGNDEQPKTLDRVFIDWVSGLKEVPLINALKGLNFGQQETRAPERQDVPPDEMFIDLRKDNCFFLPRSQGDCGSCYAFAAMALFEYIFCKDTGVLVPFSEQYMVDCGHRIGLNGCDGGRGDLTIKFVENYGLELRSEYPYSATAQTCPYDQDTTPERMGTLKTDSKEFALYDIKYIDYFLKSLPVLLAMRTTDDFSEYGGGVHDGLNCNGGGHAMLAVGFGCEDGKYFYLIRNSHSITWGESGYYKLNADALKRCTIDPFIFITKTKFTNAERNMNKDNTGKIKTFQNSLLVQKTPKL